MTSSKTASFSTKPRAWIVGPADDLAGHRVDDDEDRDEALLAEDPAVLELRLGDLADAGAVDVDVAARHGADDRRHPADQVDDRPVVAEDDPLARHAGRDREVGVGDQVPDLAVHRHDVARPDDVVAVEQLAGALAWPETWTRALPLWTTLAPSRVRPLMTR